MKRFIKRLINPRGLEDLQSLRDLPRFCKGLAAAQLALHLRRQRRAHRLHAIAAAFERAVFVRGVLAAHGGFDVGSTAAALFNQALLAASGVHDDAVAASPALIALALVAAVAFRAAAAARSVLPAVAACVAAAGFG